MWSEPAAIRLVELRPKGKGCLLNSIIVARFIDHQHNSLAFFPFWQVETALALGATPRQATFQQVKRSLVIALSPVLDNTKTVGLISLPGAMTGLIMGGASPREAIQLQIVVMNMMIGSATVSSILSTYLCWPAFFTKAYQLEYKVLSAD